jgi:hypothetical protein
LNGLLKKGAEGVLVMGCESDPDFRLGADWMGERIEGERHPEFRKDRYERPGSVSETGQTRFSKVPQGSAAVQEKRNPIKQNGQEKPFVWKMALLLEPSYHSCT